MMMSGDRHASSTSITPEESNMFLDILHEAPLFGHRKPTSIVGSIFYCLLLAGYATLAVGAPWIFHRIQEFILPLLCSCDVALLIVTGIFQQYLVYQVQKIRLQGYYIFSQKLKHIVRLPFASTSYGTAAMLLVMVWKPHIGILSIPMLLRIIMLIEVICAGFFMSVYISGFALTLGEVGTRSLQGREPSQPMEKERKRRQQEWNAFEGQGRYFMAVRCFEIFCGIWMERITGGFSDNFMHFDLFWETMTFLASVLVSTLGIPIFGELSSLIFIGYVHQYNSLESQPDVLKSLYSPLQPSSSLEGLRYHDGGRLSDQQMVLLQYQRENLHFLSEEILRLQECLSKYEKTSDGSTPQVDLAHLLAARDQELRTLSAEMNQSQSELSLARSLIAERDSEIQRFGSTNNQYVEENERLRAILGEWSTRAAKLERALEIERKLNLELQKKVSTLKSKTKYEFVEPT